MPTDTTIGAEGINLLEHMIELRQLVVQQLVVDWRCERIDNTLEGILVSNATIRVQ